MKKLFLFKCAILLMSVLVSNALSQSRIEIHPDVNKIPFWSSDHITIDTKQNLIGNPVSNTFGKILREIGSVNQKGLNVLLGGKWALSAASINDRRIVLLDKDNLTLIDYDLVSHRSFVLAQSGRGPGDLFFPKEVVVDGNNLFIPMGGSSVTQYDCSRSPCVFEKTIPLDKINYQSVDVSNNQLVGLVSAPGIAPTSNQNSNAAPLVISSLNGKVTNQFGRNYDFGNRWMLMDTFKRGFVRHVEKLNVSVVAFESYPIIYVYDDNYQLNKTYKITDFVLGKYQYNTSTQAITIPDSDFSMITGLSVLDRENLVVEVLQRKISNNSGNKILHDVFQYYIINIENNKNYYLGELNNTDSRIYLLSHGALLYSNEEYYFYKYE